MRLLLVILVIALVVVPTLALLFALYRTIGMQLGSTRRLFRSGRLPSSRPDGFYRGMVDLPGFRRWQGKRFLSNNNTGVNVLKRRGQSVERYAFTTRPAKGLSDRTLDVLQLDYNRPENPWWLRRVTDEMVEVSAGKYLGKVYVRWLPGPPLSVAYFWLER